MRIIIVRYSIECSKRSRMISIAFKSLAHPISNPNNSNAGTRHTHTRARGGRYVRIGSISPCRFHSAYVRSSKYSPRFDETPEKLGIYRMIYIIQRPISQVISPESGEAITLFKYSTAGSGGPIKAHLADWVIKLQSTA